MNTSFDIMGKTYDVEYEIEPAQRGGMTDPSWDAYVSEYAVSYKGKDLPSNKFNDLIYDLIGAELEKAE
jgi:hypothetical protein